MMDIFDGDIIETVERNGFFRWRYTYVLVHYRDSGLTWSDGEKLWMKDELERRPATVEEVRRLYGRGGSVVVVGEGRKNHLEFLQRECARKNELRALVATARTTR